MYPRKRPGHKDLTKIIKNNITFLGSDKSPRKTVSATGERNRRILCNIEYKDLTI